MKQKYGSRHFGIAILHRNLHCVQAAIKTWTRKSPRLYTTYALEGTFPQWPHCLQTPRCLVPGRGRSVHLAITPYNLSSRTATGDTVRTDHENRTADDQPGRPDQWQATAVGLSVRLKGIKYFRIRHHLS